MGNDAMMALLGTLAMVFDPTVHGLEGDDAQS